MAAPANSIYVIRIWQYQNNNDKKLMSLYQLREQAIASHADLAANMTYWTDWGSKAVPNCIKTETSVQGFVDRINGQIQMVNGTMQ